MPTTAEWIAIRDEWCERRLAKMRELLRQAQEQQSEALVAAAANVLAGVVHVQRRVITM